jgi:hypothetical protein
MVLAFIWAILSVHLAEVAYYKLISVFLVSSFDICSMPSVFQVSAFLSHIFSEIADYNFTANMETEVRTKHSSSDSSCCAFPSILVRYYGLRNQLSW